MFKVQNVCSGAGSRSERVSMGVMCSYISVRDGAVELLGSFQILTYTIQRALWNLCVFLEAVHVSRLHF